MGCVSTKWLVVAFVRASASRFLGACRFMVVALSRPLACRVSGGVSARGSARDCTSFVARESYARTQAPGWASRSRAMARHRWRHSCTGLTRVQLEHLAAEGDREHQRQAREQAERRSEECSEDGAGALLPVASVRSGRDRERSVGVAFLDMCPFASDVCFTTV